MLDTELHCNQGWSDTRDLLLSKRLNLPRKLRWGWKQQGKLFVSSFPPNEIEGMSKVEQFCRCSCSISPHKGGARKEGDVAGTTRTRAEVSRAEVSDTCTHRAANAKQANRRKEP